MRTNWLVTVVLPAHRPDHEFSREADHAGGDAHPGGGAQSGGQGAGELALCWTLKL